MKYRARSKEGKILSPWINSLTNLFDWMQENHRGERDWEVEFG